MNLTLRKFKISRGGGRHFSRDLDPRVAERDALNNPQDESSDEDDDDSSDDGIARPSRPDPSAAILPKEMAGLNLKLGNTEVVREEPSRANRKAMKKAQAKKQIVEEDSDDEEEEEDDDDLLNPQKATAKRQAEKEKAKASVKPVAPEMSRKERYVKRSVRVNQSLKPGDREAAEQKLKADRYAKAHAEGAPSRLGLRIY